jgi:replicative DNA helicase
VGGGKLWIIAGRPSMGKSASICNMMLSAAKSANGNLIFSYEMSKFDLIERFLGIETGINISDIHLGLLDQPKLDFIKNKIHEIKSLPIYVDTYFSGNIGYVTSTIRRYKKLKDIKLVFLDYVQLMVDRGDNATHELGQISRELKLLANDLEIGIVLLSQLNRNVELREDKRPILADLRQSGNLEEDADIVAMLYRDDVYYKDKSKYPGTLDFILRKNRQTGMLGSVQLNFEDVTNRISDKRK